MTNDRRAEVEAGLAQVEQDITQACAAAGRQRDEVTLIAITKTHPATDVDVLAEVGVTDVGENRHPEAAHKHADTRSPLRWHFVGGVQTNKASAVAAYADVVHSVDRTKLVRALDRGAGTAGRTLDCLIQVDFDTTNEARAGAEPERVAELADLIAASDHLRLAGVMTVAPLGADPEPAFAELQSISREVRNKHPEATIISAGMSEDFAVAIAHGATHLRIGRSILGNR